MLIGGKPVDPAYVSSLSQWIDQSSGEFAPEEERRAKQALGFLAAQIKPPSVMTPRVSKSSMVWTLVPAGALLVLCVMFGQAPWAQGMAVILPVYVLFMPAVLLLFASFVALSVGWPKWIRTLAIIAGILSWLWLSTAASAYLGNNGLNRFGLFLIFALLLTLFIMAVRKGARR